MRRLSLGVRTLLSVGMFGSLAACSSTSEPSAPSATRPLSTHEAQTVAVSIFDEISRALSGAGFSVAPSRAAFSVASMPTETVTVSSACSGGKVTGTLSVTDNTNNQGTGTLFGTMVFKMNCAISTGERTITVNGDLTENITIPLVNFEQSGNATVHVTGKFTWERDSCSMDYTVTLSPRGSGTISGLVCGMSVSGSFSA